MADEIREQGPYKMRTIARLTDFSPEVLRAWERRHGLLRPLRGPGGHRLYTEDDLRVLLKIRTMIRDGRSIGEIARIGRDALLAGSVSASVSPAPAEPAPVYVGEESGAAPGDLAQGAERIVEAALQMDAGRITHILDDAFAGTSPDHVISGLMVPAAKAIGDRWKAGRCSVASEHLASGIFAHRLRKMIESAEPERSAWRPAIVACFPDEYHHLGALIGAYWLCRNGLRVALLGAAVPFDDLRAAWDVLRPSATLLSVTRPAVYDLHRLPFRRLIAELPEGMSLYVGGQGAPQEDPGAERLGARIFPSGQALSEAMPQIVDEIRERGGRYSDQRKG